MGSQRGLRHLGLNSITLHLCVGLLSNCYWRKDSNSELVTLCD